MSVSVFQGGAESLREPLSSYSCHLNPSLGFRCASLGLALADLLFTVSQAPGGMIPSSPVERPSLGHPLPWATTSVVNPPPSLPLFGEGVFKFSENLTVLSLALCFLNHLPAGHWEKVAQPTQDLEISSPWNLRWQGFKDGLHQRAPSF